MTEQMFQTRTRFRSGPVPEHTRNYFDAAWTRATSPYLPSSSDAGEGQVAMIEGMVAVLSDDKVQGETVDDPALERTMQEEAVQRATRSFYTFTVSLRSILNPNLQQNNPEINCMDRILALLSTKQVALSNAIDEIFCLVYKTTLLVSQTLYQPRFYCT